MRKLKKELANLRKSSMTSSWRLKNLGVAAKKKKSEPKNKEKTFDDETKLEKAKLEQKLEKKLTKKEIKTLTPNCQNWLLQSSKTPPPTGCGYGRN